MNKKRVIGVIVITIVSLGLAVIIPKVMGNCSKKKRLQETKDRLSEEWEPEIVRKEDA